MEEKIIFYLELADLFKKHGFSLYLVGGTVRDYLLHLPLTDMDLVTDATPIDMAKFIPEADYTFSKFGSIKLTYKSVKFDITTLRKETGYSDSRHPNSIEFVKTLQEDVVRRDISINSLYLDSQLKTIDLVNGVDDLNHKIIRIIGDINQRFIEDPLRILRVVRFSLEFGFEIEKSTYESLKVNLPRLSLLNINKIKEELHKSHHPQEMKEFFIKLHYPLNL